MFKDKTSKKRFQNVDITRDLSTLDAMHNKIINNYSKKIIDNKIYTERINDLEINYKNINDEILKYNIDNLKLDNIYSNLWNSNIRIKEELTLLHNEINNINYFDEIEYYENTSSILFNYYEMLEKQSSSISSISSTSNNNKYKNKSILESFNITLPKEEIKEVDEDDKIVEKSDLVDQYLSITNKYYIKKLDINDNTEICTRCNIPLICLQHDAIMICNNCGYQELLLVEQNRPILKQNTKDTSHFSYKRINHFREWCNQVQGKESTDIPNDIFEKILNEIKKEKIMDTKKITYSKMREILKRLRINKYYEHINYIINRINGIPTPQFSTELEEKLCSMFRDIQGPFLKHCPKDRKNFLSYSYVLYKFFQILGLNEYLKFFPLLKSREKLYVQDQIWKKICEDLNYKIIPSL
jgi:ribosomal protein S27AE